MELLEVHRQVFVSHTQKDEIFCDKFDRVCARAGMKAFRSEFEKIKPPAWRDIRDAMRKSSAMFLLVGKNLIKKQESHGPEWEHTQNWIAYEVGLACDRGMDVWVVCDWVKINFPVPYFNNYLPHGLDSKANVDYMRWVLESYDRGSSFPFPIINREVICPDKNCSIYFNLHCSLKPNEKIVCPHCLKPMIFPKGWGSDRQE